MRLIEIVKCLFAEGHIDGSKRMFELNRARCPEDRGGHKGPCATPRECHMNWIQTMFSRDFKVGIDGREDAIRDASTKPI